MKEKKNSCPKHICFLKFVMLTCVRVQNINTIRTSLGLVLVSWRARYVRKKKLLHATRHAHMCTRTKYQHDLNIIRVSACILASKICTQKKNIARDSSCSHVYAYKISAKNIFECRIFGCWK